MKLISFVLFTLLALFYVYALPTNKLSKRSDIVRRIEKHGIKDHNDYFTWDAAGIETEGVCNENNVFNNDYKRYLESGQSMKADISARNGIFICKDKKQIPVYYGVHIKRDIMYQRFKKDDHNGMVIYSCKGNSYLTIKCEKKSDSYFY